LLLWTKTLTSTALEKLPRRLSIFTPAQREFAKVGFRPVDPTVAEEAKQYTKIKLSSLLKIWVAGILSRQSSLKRFLTKIQSATHENTASEEPI